MNLRLAVLAEHRIMTNRQSQGHCIYRASVAQRRAVKTIDNLSKSYVQNIRPRHAMKQAQSSCDKFHSGYTICSHVKPRPHVQRCRSNTFECCKANDSFDKVEYCFDKNVQFVSTLSKESFDLHISVALDNVASTSSLR